MASSRSAVSPIFSRSARSRTSTRIPFSRNRRMQSKWLTPAPTKETVFPFISSKKSAALLFIGKSPLH